MYLFTVCVNVFVMFFYSCIFGELLCAGRKLFGVEIPETKKPLAEEKCDIAKKSRKAKRENINVVNEKISSASASRVKSETVIASLHAIFKVVQM